MTKEEAAALVRQTKDEMRSLPPMAKLALEAAARAIERGRHLTPDEKLTNLRSGILADDSSGEDARWLADFITTKCGVPLPEGK